MSSATRRFPSSIAAKPLSAVPARANGVRTPATIATRRPDVPSVACAKGDSVGLLIQSMLVAHRPRAPSDSTALWRARVRRARDRRRHHGLRHRARRGAARTERRPGREGRLRERNVESLVATRARRRSVPRARPPASRVRVERRAATAASPRAAPRAPAGVHVAGVPRRPHPALEARRGAHCSTMRWRCFATSGATGG